MYICICHEVKEKQLKKAINAGMDDLDSLKENLNVATCCGCCEPLVNEILDEHRVAKLNSLAMPA